MVIDFAAESWIINQEITSFLFVFKVDSSDVTIVIDNWVDVDLKNIGVDFSEALYQFFLELFVGDFFWFAETLSNKREIGVIFFVMEKEFNFGVVVLILDSDSYFLVILEGGFSIIEFKQSAGKHSFDFIVWIFGIIDLFLLDQNWKVARFNFANEFLNNILSIFLSKLLKFSFFFLVLSIRNIVDEVKTNLHSLFLNVVADFDANSFELFSQNIEISLTDRIFSDETEKSCWF